ncbi:MAG: hypothetical protein MI794_03810 [Pseudomonadales bacterium]|nr:hypothetical protein [Pseudomonadales bacterium]
MAFALMTIGLMATTLPVLAEETVTDTISRTHGLGVEGQASFNKDDDPRVLYILPWRSPSIPRRPRAALPAAGDGFMSPLEPLTFERHRQFRQTLNPDLDSVHNQQ